MYELIYASRATTTPAPTDLVDLLDVSRMRNEDAGVTGMLLYSDRRFLQVIEGDVAEVESTFARICNDPRHTDLRLLARRPTPARRFSAWSMGFAHVDEAVLAQTVPAYTAPTHQPLVSPAVVRTGGAALVLLTRYAAQG